MEPYAISTWLTDAQKRKILSFDWRLDEKGRLSAPYGDPADEITCCPLGAATGGGSPPSPIFAARLGLEDGTAEFEVCQLDAVTFMTAADHGRIKPGDLAAALGVTA